MTLRRLIGAAAATLAFAATSLAQATLEIGDPAPPLEHITWLQGDPVPAYEKGHVYVLDFWAVWCGPCIAAIPEMVEIQEKYEAENLHVLGLAIWPRPNQAADATAEFVKSKGEAMPYTIGDDIDGKTADAYMRAAGQGGIPTVFVIDREGAVAWIGHPMSGLDEVVDLVVKGEWSAEAHAKMQEEEAKKQATIQELSQRLQAAYFGNDWSTVAAVADEMLEFDREMLSAAGVFKYVALSKMGTDEASRKTARAWGAQIISSLYEDDFDSLQALAWYVVGPESILLDEEMDTEFALLVVNKAAAMVDEDDVNRRVNVLDTMARAYFVDGQLEKAVETQREAVRLIDQQVSKLTKDEEFMVANLTQVKQTLQERLDEYEAAASAG